MKTYWIKEIFGPTIQGEGSNAGLATMFVRFAGCNKWNGLEKTKAASICNYCDTDFRGGAKMTAEIIIEHMKKLSTLRNVVLTGGEPLLQLDVELLKALSDENYYIMVETNGSIPFKDHKMEDYIDHITMSPKQSIEETHLYFCHDLKLLYPWVGEEISAKGFKYMEAKNRYIQPVWLEEKGMARNLDDAIEFITANPEYKLSLQTHKMIGVP